MSENISAPESRDRLSARVTELEAGEFGDDHVCMKSPQAEPQAPPDGSVQLKPGWLKRQADAVTGEVKAWPDWMKREAGFAPAPEKCPKCGGSRKIIDPKSIRRCLDYGDPMEEVDCPACLGGKK